MFALVHVLFLTIVSSEYTEISVFVTENGEYSVEKGLNESAVIQASFNDTVDVTGWGVLEILMSNQSSSVTDQQRAVLYSFFFFFLGVFLFWNFKQKTKQNIFLKQKSMLQVLPKDI